MAVMQSDGGPCTQQLCPTQEQFAQKVHDSLVSLSSVACDAGTSSPSTGALNRLMSLESLTQLQFNVTIPSIRACEKGVLTSPIKRAGSPGLGREFGINPHQDQQALCQAKWSPAPGGENRCPLLPRYRLS